MRLSLESTYVCGGEYTSNCIPPEVAKEMPGAKEQAGIPDTAALLKLIELAQHTRNLRHRAQQQMDLTAAVQVWGDCSNSQAERANSKQLGRDSPMQLDRGEAPLGPEQQRRLDECKAFKICDKKTR